MLLFCHSFCRHFPLILLLFGRLLVPLLFLPSYPPQLATHRRNPVFSLSVKLYLNTSGSVRCGRLVYLLDVLYEGWKRVSKCI